MLELVPDLEDTEPQGVGDEGDAQVWSFSFKVRAACGPYRELEVEPRGQTKSGNIDLGAVNILLKRICKNVWSNGCLVRFPSEMS